MAFILNQEPDQEPDPEQDWDPEKQEEQEFIRHNVRRKDSIEQCFECPHRTSCGTVWIHKLQCWKHVCPSCLHIFIVLRGDRAFSYSIEIQDFQE